MWSEKEDSASFKFDIAWLLPHRRLLLAVPYAGTGLSERGRGGYKGRESDSYAGGGAVFYGVGVFRRAAAL